MMFDADDEDADDEDADDEDADDEDAKGDKRQSESDVSIPDSVCSGECEDT